MYVIELIQLEQLETIARLKTLSATGDELHISQTALTRSMQRLEEELDVKLFDRTKNSLSLNECGKVAVEYAKKILFLSSQLKSDVQNIDRKQRIFSIGSCAPAPLWIIEEKIPQIINGRKIISELEEESELVAGLRSKKYECIIMPFSVEDSIGKITLNMTAPEKIVSQKLCEENLCFYIPKTHKYAKCSSLKFSEMNGESFIVFSKIGFWEKIHHDSLPDSNFIMMDDIKNHAEIVQNSVLPCFVTDMSLDYYDYSTFIKKRVAIPIEDDNAHAKFYLWKMEG